MNGEPVARPQVEVQEFGEAVSTDETELPEEAVQEVVQ